MANIIKEIGFKRLSKYLFFELWELIFLVLPYSPLRIIWLKLGGAKIGKGTVVNRLSFFNLDRTGLKGLIIGQDCSLGAGCLFDLAGKITLEDQVTLSPRVVILSHHSVGFSDHPLIKFYPKKIYHTILRQGCVLGVNSIILPGNTIGQSSMIAAGSLVRENIPEKVMVAGIPAQIKKHFK